MRPQLDNMELYIDFKFPRTSTSIDVELLYPDSGISMDEEIVLGVMMWSYNKAEL